MPWWARCPMSPGSKLLCGDREGVAIGVVLYHQATRLQQGGGPQISIWHPHLLTSWKRKGLAWGEPAELTGLQKCVKNMISKKIKLVNMVQVMLL